MQNGAYMPRLKYLHIYFPIFITVWLGLFLDSNTVALELPYNQWLTNALVAINFLWVYFNASKSIKQLMLFGVLVALGGEILFSLILGMYSYRLGNIPVYIPFGHALLYASVYYITKEPLVRKQPHRLIRLLYPFMVVYALSWLIMANDLLGFTCTIIILFLLHKQPSSKPFFLIMFFMVVYLELVGTHYQCWLWPEIWFNSFSWMPSANPPSGIGVFYFAFDLGCLWLYKQQNRHRWSRFRNIQALRKKQTFTT